MKLSDYGVNSNSLGDSSVHLGSGEYLEQLYNLDNQQSLMYGVLTNEQEELTEHTNGAKIGKVGES